MKKLLFLLISFGFCYTKILAQNFDRESYQENEPRKIFMNTHDPNFKSFPEKSFYKSRDDWQYIIDTTWGAGLPLAQKQQIFNIFTTNIRNSFDGFQSLGMSLATWDSIKSYYYSQINSSTSRGRFAAIMNQVCSKMRDGHTYCDDIALYATPLNPGVPFFMFGGLIINANHFGAVTTVLPDSSVMILRVVNNHPLNLEPGDIILGYEGIPWKNLIEELMEAELPNFDWWGGYDGTFTDHLFIGAGMNWHLFDTIDVLKYSNGDTVHLSVAPMVNLNVPAMANNEQMEIPGIPFPNFSSGQYVSYGILNNTNIGYIFTYSEGGSGNSQFDQAVASLKNTDALIIDMRWNTGGTTGWSGAFKILANESFPTLEFAPRCNSNDFTLCPNGSVGTCYVTGSGTGAYDRPIAVLLGPNCISTGDRNAYRLKYLYNVRTFGRPTWSSLGSSIYPTYSGWDMRVSSADMLHTNNPGVYLNRREFPIDFPVWHNRDDVAVGNDAVVEKALDWINNLVYPHSTFSDKTFYTPGEDSPHLYTTIENPNSHQLSARAYLKTLVGVLIDSVELVKQTLNTDGEQWTADLNLPSTEEFYKIALTVFDQTATDNFSVPNAARFTTVGPVVLDSISWSVVSTYYSVKPFLKNQSTANTITNASVRLICNDPWVTSITPTSRTLPNISPGSIVSPSSPFTVNINNSIFPGYFNFKVEVMSNEWIYWTDSMQVGSNFPLIVSIANGWNMVSIPGLHPVNQNVLTWWSGKDPLAEVFKYGGVGYIITNTATTGEGYWMKHVGANVYNTGEEWPAIQIVTHNPIAGNLGWNLIGGYEQSVATSGLTTNPPGLITGPVYKYATGYQIATTLDPGYGYWIKLTGAGQIIIPNALEKGSREVEYFSDDWGKIIITDAAGISYTLYAVKGQVDLSQYELPPIPMAGMFDIRYSSGRIAEDLNSAIKTIDISGVTYPLTVRVENMDIRLQDESGKKINSELIPGEQITIDNATVNKLLVFSSRIGLPTEYALEQNYPNPFNPSTTFRYSISQTSKVVIKVYDILGNEIATLMNEEKQVGNYELTWNASSLPSGVYFYQLKAGSFVETKKMLLLK